MTLATLADVIEEAALAKRTKKALSDDLVEEVDNLPDFEFENKSDYYTHLVTNPDIATVFMSLSYKITWVTSFVNERC
jgi:phosphopantetheine adenylyltransferase